MGINETLMYFMEFIIGVSLVSVVFGIILAKVFF